MELNVEVRQASVEPQILLMQVVNIIIIIIQVPSMDMPHMVHQPKCLPLPNCHEVLLMSQPSLNNPQAMSNPTTIPSRLSLKQNSYSMMVQERPSVWDQICFVYMP
jgi:hypothetical protein